ncbi:MFS transporter [Oceanispirochaeta sp.]|jgi:MFS family permease|uniref:MFS transporter n=1 Tax=Oceanispirochaeta sp. TaxID=2035350 RepID=UPI002611823A|nr:MFS transporter [Oceanispirochaeta sp.]MDA3955346.1 MFS transporter [Oceanispirochaeta sp.]
MKSMRAAFNSTRIERYGLFLLVMMLFGLGGGLFRGVQDNYLAFLGIDEAGRGVVEFFRELPGLLLFLLLALLYKMAERYIIRLALGFSVAGMLGFLAIGTGIVPAVFCLTLWSLGEHLIMPVRQSYAIHSAEPGKEGMAIGFLRGVVNAGQVVGLALVPLIFLLPQVQRDRDAGGRLGFVIVFTAVGFMILLALTAAFGMVQSQGKLQRKRLYFDRKYKKYYGLEMFYGARKQVFLTFGPYLLILHYGAQTEYLASLLGICALFNIFFTPLIGRLIDRLGYRTIMIGDTVILFFVCLLYGFAHRIFPREVAIWVVSINFVIDWIVSNASMAASVYVSRISEGKEEMTAALSTGISINHLISVIIAFGGGFLWKFFGVEWLFILAAVMAVANSLFAMTVPRVQAHSLKNPVEEAVPGV